MLNITINGKSASQPEGSVVSAIINALPLSGKRFAVERNGEIVPKSQLEQIMIADGDIYEIVIAVGGG